MTDTEHDDGPSPPCTPFTVAGPRPAGATPLFGDVVDLGAVRPLPAELRDAIERGLSRFNEAHPE